MDSRRGKPYVWVSWITPLLAGIDKCRWKSWVKAHFRYAKRPDDGTFDLSEWIKQHDEMTANRVARLTVEGYEVKVEGQNSFKLDGKNSVLAGKPDIVGLRPAERKALVVDEKSGKKKGSDRWQVFIYMWAMSLTVLKGWRIAGEVEYRGESVEIAPDDLSLDVKKEISLIMQMVGGDVAPPTTPSVTECGYCDILECPDRIVTETKTADASSYF